MTGIESRIVHCEARTACPASPANPMCWAAGDSQSRRASFWRKRKVCGIDNSEVFDLMILEPLSPSNELCQAVRYPLVACGVSGSETAGVEELLSRGSFSGQRGWVLWCYGKRRTWSARKRSRVRMVIECVHFRSLEVSFPRAWAFRFIWRCGRRSHMRKDVSGHSWRGTYLPTPCLSVEHVGSLELRARI